MTVTLSPLLSQKHYKNLHTPTTKKSVKMEHHDADAATRQIIEDNQGVRQAVNRPINRTHWDEHMQNTYCGFILCLEWEVEWIDEEWNDLKTNFCGLLFMVNRAYQNEMQVVELIRVIRTVIAQFRRNSTLSNDHKNLVALAVKLHFSMVMRLTREDEWMWRHTFNEDRQIRY